MNVLDYSGNEMEEDQGRINCDLCYLQRSGAHGDYDWETRNALETIMYSDYY